MTSRKTVSRSTAVYLKGNGSGKGRELEKVKEKYKVK